VPLQRHSFALECLFRAEKPLTDVKLKAVRERVRASFSRLRLITQASDDLQNAGATPPTPPPPPPSPRRPPPRFSLCVGRSPLMLPPLLSPPSGFCFLLRSDGQQVQQHPARQLRLGFPNVT
jgi:hypothetical protein